MGQSRYFWKKLFYMKVAYLLGAGASTPYFPILNNLPKRLLEIGGNLRSFMFKRTASPPNITGSNEFVADVENRFQELAKISEEHSSIDTYAKKLWIKHNVKDLHHLKTSLVLYFLMEMLDKAGERDKRYDNLWASLIDTNSQRLPDDLSILTWNYDPLLETSLKEYIEHPHAIVNFNDGSHYIRSNINGKFNIFKLNGSGVNKYEKLDSEIISDPIIENYSEGFSETNIKLLMDFLSINTSFNNDSHNSPGITYSWETLHNRCPRHNQIEDAATWIQDYDVLVVIGYSFPFFNRTSDRLLFQNSKISKIYIQDNKGENIKKTLLSIFDFKKLDQKNIEVLPIDEKQFFIPFEL